MIYRKKKPSPPKWMASDTDNCWQCKRKSGCGNCKFLKQYIKENQTLSRRIQKQKLEREYKNEYIQ